MLLTFLPRRRWCAGRHDLHDNACVCGYFIILKATEMTTISTEASSHPRKSLLVVVTLSQSDRQQTIKFVGFEVSDSIVKHINSRGNLSKTTCFFSSFVLPFFIFSYSHSSVHFVTNNSCYLNNKSITFSSSLSLYLFTSLCSSAVFDEEFLFTMLKCIKNVETRISLLPIPMHPMNEVITNVRAIFTCMLKQHLLYKCRR